MSQSCEIDADISATAADNGHASEIAIAGVALVMDCEGALYWPAEGCLVCADLHLEKGSSFAARGVLLPPYDTAATLARMASLIARYAPRAVIALGDSFHDNEGLRASVRAIAQRWRRFSADAIGSGSRAIMIPVRPSPWAAAPGRRSPSARWCFAMRRLVPRARSPVICTRSRA